MNNLTHISRALSRIGTTYSWDQSKCNTGISYINNIWY